VAAIAIPAYLDYTVRSQISEGLSDEHDIIGNYTEHVSVASNVIEIKYCNNCNTVIFDEKIELTATASGGSIVWTCASAGVIQAKHLPTVCR